MIIFDDFVIVVVIMKILTICIAFKLLLVNALSKKMLLEVCLFH